MNVYTMVVDVKPKVKARPRATKTGRVYTPATTLEQEKIIAGAWQDQIGETITEPVEVTLVYTPDSTTVHVTSSPHNSTTLRGDLDNYIKLTLDALNGVAWVDDKQVVRISAVKVDRLEN